jgi:hypothetical protein
MTGELNGQGQASKASADNCYGRLLWARHAELESNRKPMFSWAWKSGGPFSVSTRDESSGETDDQTAAGKSREGPR